MEKKRDRRLFFNVVMVLIVAVIPCLSAFALEYQIVPSPIAQVSIWLDERAVLDNVQITNNKYPNEIIIVRLFSNEAATQEVEPGKYYKFFAVQPRYGLSNGDYKLAFDAVDLVGNRMKYEIPFSVGTDVKPIELLNPRHGVSQTVEFDLIAGTLASASCKYALYYFSNQAFVEDPRIPSFDSSANTGTIHTITNFHTKFDPRQNPRIYIKCSAPNNNFLENDFIISVDTTPPTVQLRFDPATIVYVSQAKNISEYKPAEFRQRTNIIVSANEPVVCAYALGKHSSLVSNVSITPFVREGDALYNERTGESIFNTITSNYKSEISIPYAYAGDDYSNKSLKKDIDFTVQCRDLSGRLSSVRHAALKIDMTAPLTIDMVSPPPVPGATTNSTLDLFLATNKPSNCRYDLSGGNFDETSQPTSSTTGLPVLTHEKKPLGTFTDGTYTLTARCISIDKTAVKVFKFTVDNTPPVMISVEDGNATWRADRLVADFAANDSETRIVGYFYYIKNPFAPIMEEVYIAGGESLQGVEASGLNLTDLETYYWVVRAKNAAGLESTAITSDGILVDKSLDAGLCQNKKQDINEIDVDCGGDCGPCADGQKCFIDADCLSQKCEDGVCAPNLCRNGVIDIGETDVDCGGDCGPCADGKKCIFNSDCLNDFCNEEGICESALCDDGIKNGYETDVDCGGFACGPCINGLKCSMGSDCLSGYCNENGICEEPVCSDPDFNCGGNCPKKCDVGQVCGVNEDCLTGSCSSGLCAMRADVDDDWRLRQDEYIPDYDSEPKNVMFTFLIVIIIAVAAILGGYYYYMNYIKKKEQAPSMAPKPLVRKPETAFRPAAPGKPAEKEAPKKKVETAHERFMKKRAEKSRERMRVFEEFGAKPSATEMFRDIVKTHRPSAERRKAREEAPKGGKPEAKKKEEPKKPEEAEEFKRLSERLGKKGAFEALEKYKGKGNIEKLVKEDAFERLSEKLDAVDIDKATSRQKGILEDDLFAKLPTTKREIKDIISKPRVGKILEKISKGEESDVIDDLSKIGKRDVKALVGEKEKPFSRLSKLSKKRKGG